MTDTTSLNCQCQCGNVQYTASAMPMFRILCHCSICRQFNGGAPFADVLTFRNADIIRPSDGTVNFQTYRPPPNVQRGQCAACHAPAIEVFEAPLFPKLIMVPSSVVQDSAALPEPVGHMFYDSRVADVTDSLPKWSGYFRSQLGFGRYLLASMLRR
ncbi:MAG: GFA family protein [Pseudomonadota bacterium]